MQPHAPLPRSPIATVLPIEIAHVAEPGALPHRHGGPFDRMRVAQARVERLTILSRDAALSAYDVAIRW